MATNPTIQLKRKTTSGTPSSLSIGEPAVNTADNQLFIGVNSSGIKWVGAEIENSSTNGTTWSSDLKLATKKAIGDYFAPLSGAIFTGDITLSGGSDIRFRETGGGTDYVAFQAPSAVSTGNVTLTLPGSYAASDGYVLSSTTTGTLSWISAGSASSVTITEASSNASYNLVFTDATSTTSASLFIDSDDLISYNPSTNLLTLGGDLAINGADITTTATGNATLFDSSATGVYVGTGAATDVRIGKTDNTGTTRIYGDLASAKGAITTSASTASIFNTGATTLNIGGASTSTTIGSSVSGTLTLGSPTVVGQSTSQALYNTGATTMNFAGAATAITMGDATSATTTIRGGTLVGNTTTQNLFNTTATTLNLGGAATTVSIGAATGTTTINNANTVVTGDLAVNGADITTTATGTATLFNTNATTVNIGGAATNMTIGASTATINLGGGTTGATVVIKGNLQVDGVTTTINSTTLSVDDKNIVLGADNTLDTAADGGGITLKGGSDKTFNWVDATDAWTSSEHMNLLTGKAYYINGTSVLNSTTLGSTITSSSLTTVGTIASGTWNGTVIGLSYGGTGKALTAANGGIVYSDADSFEILGAGTSGQVLTSGGAGAPTWTTQSSLTAGTITTTSDNTNAVRYLVFSTSAGAAKTLYVDDTTGVLSYNPSVGTLTSTNFACSATTGVVSTNIINSFGLDGNVVITSQGSDTGAVLTLTGSAAPGAESITLGAGSVSIQGNVTMGGIASSIELPTTFTIQDSATVSNTLNIATAATASGNTKTLNLGTGAASGSTTTINIGSANGGTTTINSANTVVSGDLAVNGGDITTTTTGTATLFNTTATTITIGSAAGTINLGNSTTGATIRVRGILQVDGNTSLATVTAGTWNGTAIGAAYGGTGQTSYTVGDLVYASGSTAISKLSASSTAGAVLASTGSASAPEYKTISFTNGSVTSGSGTLTLAVQNAAADSSTKGIATFDSTQFDDSSGLITLGTIDGGTYA